MEFSFWKLKWESSSVVWNTYPEPNALHDETSAYATYCCVEFCQILSPYEVVTSNPDQNPSHPHSFASLSISGSA